MRQMKVYGIYTPVRANINSSKCPTTYKLSLLPLTLSWCHRMRFVVSICWGRRWMHRSSWGERQRVDWSRWHLCIAAMSTHWTFNGRFLVQWRAWWRRIFGTGSYLRAMKRWRQLWWWPYLNCVAWYWSGWSTDSCTMFVSISWAWWEIESLRRILEKLWFLAFCIPWAI